MNYIGINPGKNGGIAVIHSSGMTELFVFPKLGLDIDLHALWKIVNALPKNSLTTLESVHSIQGTGAKSNFEFGGTFFLLQMALVAANLPYQLVTPKTWQKIMFEGLTPILSKDGTRDTKSMALRAMTALYPDVDATPTARSTKSHTGLVDALLLATYGKRSNAR